MNRTFIRVETIKIENNRIVGGMFSAAWAFIFKSFNLAPTATAEEIYNKAIKYPSDYIGNKLLAAVSILGDMPIPEIYQDNHEKYICLYKSTYFTKQKDILAELSNLIKDVSGNCGVPLAFIYRKVKVNDKIIEYEDDCQIIVDKQKIKIADAFNYF